MIHSRNVTRSAAALLAAGAPFCRKDAAGGDDPIEALAKSFGEHIDTVMARLNGTDQKTTSLRDQLAEIRQQLARGTFGGGGGGGGYAPSWGEQVANAPEIAGLADAGQKAKARILIKSTTTGDGIAPAERVPDISTLPKRRLVVRDLLGAGRTSSASVEFLRQSGFVNRAAPVAEGAAKPESDITFELLDTKVRTIAHWVKASRQVLDDIPLLQTTIDGELRFGVAFAEDVQLLVGDGTGVNLHGMIPQATAYEVARNQVGDTRFDTLLHALEQAEIAELPASGIIVNTSDWYGMLGIKDGDGNYVSGGPLADVPERIWRLPVVYTNAMAAGSFLVGAFGTAVTLYDRMQTTVEAGYVNDDFTKNLITLLGEERVALAIKRPEALITGDFPA